MKLTERVKSKDEPKGGWLGPPPTSGVPAIAEYRPIKKGKKTKLVRVSLKLSKKDKKKRKLWEQAMAKANKKGKWRFKWK